MPLDRALAATGLFPLILGGHDHDAHLEVISHHHGDAKDAAMAARKDDNSPSAAGAVATRVSSAAGEAATVVAKVMNDKHVRAFFLHV